MNTQIISRLLLAISTMLLLSACSVAKLEARLEANPQCKDIINPKTGALMPCPGSDKAFYREVGLAPAKPTPVANTQILSTPVTNTSAPPSGTPISNTVVASPSKANPASIDCKPQIHKKTGGTLPCPAPD